GMSHLAMLWRLVSEGYLSQEKLDDYNYGVISAARTLGYDDKLYNPTPIKFQRRTYGHYLKQVEELRQKDLVSSGKIDELLLDAFRDDIAFGLDDDQEGEAID
ncbi:MAG: toxin-antitoxin system, toxin component, partial [Eubacterium sp.]|nr:toxin-antitoxin system, toxin component [Eubacterium sp.]